MKQKLLMTASTWRHILSFHIPYLMAFQERGWEVHVAAEGVPSSTPYADKTIPLPFVKKLYAPQNLLALFRLRRGIAKEQYSLIITHTSLAAFYTRLAVKYLKKRPPVVNVMHGYLFDDDTPFLKKQLLLGAERLTAKETDLLLTMNEWDDQAARRYRLGRRVAKIPGMGVDFSRRDDAASEDGARLRRELGISKEAFVLLYAAEFSRRKSQPVLIEAMRELPPNAVLVLCGSGATLAECKALAGRLNLNGRVLFPGQVANMPVWYRMADAVVTASRSEGLPFNVMEAMYCGLPVVASAVKGHTDLIVDGETGLLYPYGDAKACAACVRRLMDSAQLRERLSEQARGNVLRYGIEDVLVEVMEQYGGMLEKRKAVQQKVPEHRGLSHSRRSDFEMQLNQTGGAERDVQLSILMSVYNGGDTLPDAMDSLLNQTLTDFELIVCDDCSTDNSWQILKDYAQRDARVIAFRNQKNLGLGASLNRCLAKARGDYIARQDADDYSAPDRLERTLAYIQAHQLPYAGCGVYIFDDDGIWSQRCFPEHINRHIIAQKNPFFHPTMIFHRQVLESVNGYCEQDMTRRTEDYDLVMRLAAKGVIGQNLQEYLYYVYEPPEAYLRHTKRTRLNEVQVRWKGLRCMKAPARDYIYLCKPVIMALIPRFLLRKVKELQWQKERIRSNVDK